MNDFLHNLRMGNHKGYQQNRRQHDNPRYRSNDRQGPPPNRDKRRSSQSLMLTGEYLVSIRKLFEEMLEVQKNQARTTERQAEALEAIAAFVQTLSGDIPVKMAPTPSISVPESDRDTTEVANASAVTAPAEQTPSQPFEDRPQTAIKIIKRMRDEGSSYEKIARYLKTNAVPTPSGRGIWRGQAVSKLYNMSVS